MSKTQIKRWGLASLQALVVLIVTTAVVTVLLDPECARLMLEEVARGIVCGLFYGMVKSLSRLAHPRRATQPVRCWWCYTAAVLKHEITAGLVGGWLLGLAMGVWHAITC